MSRPDSTRTAQAKAAAQARRTARRNKHTALRVAPVPAFRPEPVYGELVHA